MQSTMIRLAVALLAFGLGVSATMFWIAYRTPDVRDLERNPPPRVILVAPHHRTTHSDVPPLPPPPAPPLDELPPPPPPAPLVTISGGVLNGKAISLPQPAYPPLAKAARASGVVHVQVLLDENGTVISANAIAGHPLLQHAAVQAARRASFAPTRLSGQPVKVSGTIAYNFVLQ
ncbi:MAG TPA: energy transducer TonB [Pyrinomonadaceae bacterium]|nr:energy transducer TonB [Pyrinomonadaceae bacterium]